MLAILTYPLFAYPNPHHSIPIGYWSIPLTSSDTKESTDSSPYVTGAWDFLLRAVSWANNHGLQVIIDLHGAPGSQNGYDNSGELTNNPVWAVNQGNISRTVDTIKFLAKTFGSDVGMIELLNEAAGFRGDDWANAVRQYWLDGYAAVRASGGQDVQVMIGEAFMGFDVRGLCLLRAKTDFENRLGRTSYPIRGHRVFSWTM